MIENRRPRNLVLPGPSHRRILPPEAIQAMEHEIAESMRESMDVMARLEQEPITEEEGQEILDYCNCKPVGHKHAPDCTITDGLYAVAKKRTLQPMFPSETTRLSPLDVFPDLPHREIPAEEIPGMEHDFVETFREWMPIRAYLQAPFTEDEQRELDRVMNSCNCQPRIPRAHVYDCSVIVGLITFANKRKPQS